MNLYKAHGVSPFGGCLPSLIQMPIWIALYSTLNYAVELYRAPFFGHIHDLTAKDPYYVTPLVMGGVMFLQMKMSPTGADPQQQAMMTIMMPLMFTAFSLFLPSGLARVHVDELPDRHPAAALRQPSGPQGRDPGLIGAAVPRKR